MQRYADKNYSYKDRYENKPKSVNKDANAPNMMRTTNQVFYPSWNQGVLYFSLYLNSLKNWHAKVRILETSKK